MYEPVTIVQIGEFVQVVMTAFSDPLFMAFTLMIAFSVSYGIKRLVVD